MLFPDLKVLLFSLQMFHIGTHPLLQWNSNPWTLLNLLLKQVRDTTGIRTRALLRGEKYETESQSLKENIFLICLMICSWDVLYFRAGNSRCLAPVVLMSEPVIWKVIRRKLVNSTKASKMKIQKIVFLLKTRLKEMILGCKPWENFVGI